uniref:Uncharacterized protein n=1 Tax=viral metagenome TaxID=1070528 RepID=A0A6H1ZMY2_9ZZZZ
MSVGIPFHDVYDGIWTCLESRAEFTTAVASGNRIKYTADVETILAWDVAAEESPEVAVVQARMRPGDRNDVAHSECIINWEIWLRAHQQNASDFFDIQWACYRGLSDWMTYLRDALDWSTDLNYVRDCNILSTDESLLRSLHGSKTNRWATAWVFETKLWFTHANLVGT